VRRNASPGRIPDPAARRPAGSGASRAACARRHERISGNAAAGIVLVHEGDTIGVDRLWAYLSEPVAAKLKLRLSSIDGRYYAEVDYATAAPQAGWVALDLSLREFAFLEKNYDEPMNEIAALLSDGDSPRFYPVRWGAPHRSAGAAAPDPPKADDPLRIYMNTERAQAFVVVDGAPDYCRDASAVSGFKFNAVCDVELGDLALPAPGGKSVVEGIEVLRRSGVRSLAPLALDVRIAY
jgi:hypothetical protein